MNKIIIVAALLICNQLAHSQSFSLTPPAGWSQTEQMVFPIDFAPHIPFVGEEHLIFSPGWGEVDSEEHWSYFFVWWIEKDSKITAELLDAYIKEYYTGLVGRNIVSRKIDSKKVVPTVASFKQLNPRVFQGTVDMLDYHSQKPIKLLIDVDLYPCDSQGKLAVFVAVSPQPRTHLVWSKYKSIRESFKCVK